MKRCQHLIDHAMRPRHWIHIEDIAGPPPPFGHSKPLMEQRLDQLDLDAEQVLLSYFESTVIQIWIFLHYKYVYGGVAAESERR